MADDTIYNQVIAFLCCEHFSVDAQHRPSYISVFEGISLKEIPGSLARFFVVVQIKNPRGELVSLRLRHPESTSIGTVNLGNIELGEAFKFTILRAIWEAQNLPFPGEGTYTLE